MHSSKFYSYMGRIMFLSVAIHFIAHSSFAFSNDYKLQPFSISGTIKGQTQGSMVFAYWKYRQLYVRDTIQITDGKFFWQGALQQTTQAQLNLLNENGQELEGEGTYVYLSPGNMQMILEKGRLDECVIKGSVAQADLLASREFMKPADTYMHSVLDSTRYYRALLKKQPKNNQAIEKAAFWEQKIDVAQDARFLQQRRFIAIHLNAMVSANILYLQQGWVSVDTLRAMYNMLSTEVKESYDGIKIGTYVKRWPISEAPNFEVADIYGDSIHLSQYFGKKMVLLDFWASWCGPCRADNPGLRKLYAKYATSGLEIISISVMERKREHLDKAIAEDSVGAWRHVLSDMFELESVIKLYGVQPVPDKILINKEGQIIYRKNDRGLETLEAKLKELFGF